MNFIEDISSKNLSNLDSPAIITIKRNLTYNELLEEVKRTAGSLLRYNIPKNKPVAILSDNNYDFIILVMALWMIDTVPAPVNTRLTQKEIKELLKISGSSILFIHKKLEKNLKDKFPNTKLFPFKNKLEKPCEIKSQYNLNNTAVIIFTSGSSGKPKGVMLSFNNLLRSAELGNSFLEQTNSDRWFASLPFYHIGGFSIITRALIFGTSIIIPDSLNNNDIVKSLQKFRPTLASFVSTQMERLIESSIVPGNELRNVLLGGGFINNSLIVKALKSGWKISKVYGSSETSSFVTALHTDELKIKINSAGKALPCNQVIICDENRKELPGNTVGEIAVKSDSVMMGYINNPEENKRKLVNEYYYTGDTGYLDEDGFLFVEARLSDFIVSGGENINTKEIEKAIIKYPGITDCCIIGIVDKTWGHKVSAAIVSNETIAVRDLIKFLKRSLAGFKIPKQILQVKTIPKNQMGKIEKKKLEKLFTENYSNSNVLH